MRIKSKYKSGDTRVIKKFLFLPKTLNDETRWLEISRIKQQFDYYFDFIIPWYMWLDETWVD